MDDALLDFDSMAAKRPPIELNSSWMNAAGTLGFAPPAKWPLPQSPAAFVTNLISYRPRPPAQDRTLITFPGGFMLHTGWPSPGFDKIIRQYAPRWERASVPIWAHLLGDTPAHVERMVRRLEEIENLSAVELGFPYHATGVEVLDLISAARGELPVILAVPLDRIRASWLAQAAYIGLAAISISPPRGIARTASGSLVHGRLYGPALLPHTRAALEYLLELRLPVIAGCGIMKAAEIEDMIRAGAACTQLDFILWRGWPPAGAD